MDDDRVSWFLEFLDFLLAIAPDLFGWLLSPASVGWRWLWWVAGVVFVGLLLIYL